MVKGNKINATVPAIIINKVKSVPHFLRGLFDTDGCLKFSKQKKNMNYYPRIQFWFRDDNFSREVGELLKISNFGVGTWREKRFNGLLVYYQISGKDNLEE